MNQERLEQESSVMEQETSDDIIVDHEQSLLSQFQIMKSEIDLKRKDLEVSNKQRIIDKLLKQVEVQAERAESLIKDKSAKCLIVAQCEKLRITI